MQIVRHALGDVPLVGFFAGGEIAHQHLYGYTGVLTVFCAGRSLSLHPDSAVRAKTIPSIRWLQAQQRADGSWGLWAGTAEDTAYAILTLVHSKIPGTREALRRGQAWIEAHYTDPRPELCIGKQLYSPIRVVEAAVLAALQAK